MKKPKIYKYFIFTLIVSTIFGSITYLSLSNRHQAIVKTKLLHSLHLVDNNWEIKNNADIYKMLSPTLLIDGIYKSMEGPKSSRYIQLSNSDELLWITGFDVKALEAETEKEISKDFICHMNVDLNDVHYYSNFNLENRIGKQYPRLTSLSNGFESFNFPKGYGVPIKGNEYLFITTQALNLNEPKIFKKVKHLVTVAHEKYNGTQKPLLSRTVFIQLPFDKENPFKTPLSPGSNQCIPVETKNHCYTDRNGNMLSGHWVIPKGKATYRSSIDEQLQIQDSLRLHFSAIHVHPFATSISLYDATAQQTLFTSTIQNHTDRIGLAKVEPFSSENGIWLYANHRYELVMKTDNTSAITQDMMGSMFLFFYDKEMDEQLQKNQNKR